ncbi:hypothetical protein L2152_10420, partial [Corynebacterium diphtheriae]|nr:hypothetical protein [Corynebacterium diphtheriae bv. mitis]MCM0112395.1 hypothetical protein [Corynebacterium diphtheriae]MCM0146771.1 hypothetical protein [Corynebacterium diphtheriae]MCM0153739.1 hypothetical protein [Corynebacterium diphtheriae]MCM0160289.1 hypothetical protein [Corynebacterium diphtheriae]
VLSTPPAFVLSQDQTLHKKISQTQKMHQPTLQAGTSPTNWLKTTTNNTTLFATGKKINDLLYQKRGHHPLTGKNNNDHQHNNSQ